MEHGVFSEVEETDGRIKVYIIVQVWRLVQFAERLVV